MKRYLAIFMVLAMVMGSMGTAFAGSAAPYDVQGTRFEEAATNVIAKGIFAGYDDGSFRPDVAITRAEICVMLAHAMGATEADLNAAPSLAYKDLTSHNWAEKYINYAAAKGIVSGYGNDMFKPGETINFNEIVTLLVSALGYGGTSLEGTWPQNFVTKAGEIGILNSIPDSVKTAKSVWYDAEGNLREGGEGSAAITRGDVAIMINNIADQLVNAPGVAQ